MFLRVYLSKLWISIFKCIVKTCKVKTAYNNIIDKNPELNWGKVRVY